MVVAKKAGRERERERLSSLSGKQAGAKVLLGKSCDCLCNFFFFFFVRRKMLLLIDSRTSGWLVGGCNSRCDVVKLLDFLLPSCEVCVLRRGVGGEREEEKVKT